MGKSLEQVKQEMINQCKLNIKSLTNQKQYLNSRGKQVMKDKIHEERQKLIIINGQS